VNGILLLEGLSFLSSGRPVHHLANICQASPPFRVGCRTVASAVFLLFHDTGHNCRPSIFSQIRPDILCCITETVTNQILSHFLPLPDYWTLTGLYPAMSQKKALHFSFARVDHSGGHHGHGQHNNIHDEKRTGQTARVHTGTSVAGA